MALPDSRACWPVAACAAVFVFFGMMLTKSESVMYIGFMGMLHINREEASWPLTIAIIMSQLLGPLYGLLGLWLSDRILLVAGALLCALPVMACALAQNLGQVIFLYGVLYGLGVACEELLPFTVVARHFVRYRGTAMGLLFVVTAMSGFVSPLIVETLRQAFDFRIALLILGALQLNMLFGCIYVDRVPRSDDNCSSGHNGSELPKSPLAVRRPRRSSFQAASFAHSCSKSLVESFTAVSGHADGLKAGRLSRRSIPPNLRPREADSLLEKCDSPSRRLARNMRSLLSAQFLHVAASRAVSLFVLSSFLLTAVDFGSDNGLSGYEAVALVTVSAVGDLVSRIGTGLILDSKVISADALMLWSFAIQAASLAVMALDKRYWILLASCFFTGVTGGGRIFACTVMVAELFDERSLPLSLGVTNFIAGIICLARPPLIGYIRDVMGSYDALYISFAVTNAIFTITWAISLCWQKCHRKREWHFIDDFAGEEQETRN
ncbi:monocarboxylate transporter 12-like [Dermacentor andersoni]|uniref:monocarboxylate transporter 12-like n=1 Tax=Dermacentor andersoni TaxID=34620 RepID=UPI00241656F7|nr:monocarboxylate transporter 9-like [Dermacentor andersoni]